MSADAVTASQQKTWKPGFQFEVLSGMFILGFLAAFVGACWNYAKTSSDGDWLFVVSILGLPLFQVPFVILMLKRDSEFGRNGVLVLVPSLTLEVALWWVFNLRGEFKSLLPYATLFGLGWALMLGVVVFCVTALIMGVADGRGKDFRKVLQDHPFLVVCFFLTIFTFIALFLSLSLALHDQDLRLNKTTFGVYSKAFDSIPPGSGKPAQNTGAEPLTILFTKGSAAVEFIQANKDAPAGTKGHRTASNPDVSRKEDNNEALDSLTKQIADLAEKDHVRVVLAGHSNDLPLEKSSSYKSNLELSLARIHQVIVNLLGRLKLQSKQEWRRNIDWMMLPCANEQSFLDGNNNREPEDRLAVEILVLPSDKDRFASGLQPGGKDLNLLDYLYFGVYTITTTGNGDIIPVSSYAKFLTTVANFFAIFLLVVFFNVLLSFLRDDRDRVRREQAAGA
ncbi:MAG TPA: ion channel [Thermoanaerobaculia bacterium]|nr:ion channel [Thermoanaerobaculia bacterium]